MGIYVKGMKMPKVCFDCDLYGDENNFCKAQKEYMPFASFGRDHKDANCPLVEVPEPHGDLIDRDALNLEYEVEMADDWKTAHEIANCVKYAPVMIEAEGE